MIAKPLLNKTPLTNKMIEILMDCHEKELMKVEPCLATNTKGIRGLIERGMLRTSILITEKGKRIVAFYVTDSAKRYLSKLTRS